jgi:hypothetical protein
MDMKRLAAPSSSKDLDAYPDERHAADLKSRQALAATLKEDCPLCAERVGFALVIHTHSHRST